MTKKTYLKKLESLIQALPADERKEALDYYSNYFDDADDDDKVFEELGEPEELAKAIIEKFSCVPASPKKEEKDESADSEQSDFFNRAESFETDEKLSFSFSKRQVKNLGIAIGAGNVVLKTGSDFKVETRGILSEDFRCEINEAGTLIIENRRAIPRKKFFSHDERAHWCPRILITLPEKAVFENTKITLGAGQIRTKKLNIKSLRTMIDVSAGNFELSGIDSSMSSISCGMGNVMINGTFSGVTKLDCGMGCIKIKMPVSAAGYSYEGKVAMGSISFNKDKRSGFAQNYYGEKKENHFIIKCGMGEVKVSFDEF